jgi:fructokinase
MLISIGEILVDIFEDGRHKDVLPGGAPFNVACNALLYTDKVTFYGAVGDDENGRMLLDTVNKNSFDHPHIKVLSDKYTSRAIVSLKDGERSFRFERDDGADYQLRVNDIDLSNLKDEDIVHIGSLMLSYESGVSFYNGLVKQIRSSSKAKISFDINYRDDIFSSPDEAKKIFISALKQADILKFSLEELELLTNKKDILEALKKLLNDKQIAVITLGSDGSMFYKDRKLIKVPTIKVKPVDTTGAGDAFYSYFLASLVNDPSFINDEKKVRFNLERANVVGALATQAKGAIGVAPSKEEIQKFLDLRHN